MGGDGDLINDKVDAAPHTLTTKDFISDLRVKLVGFLQGVNNDAGESAANNAKLRPYTIAGLS